MEQFLGGWSAITPLGLVIIILLVFYMSLNRGTLWTGKQHQESMNQKDEIIGIWKAAAEKAETALAEQVRQNGLLVNQGEAFTHFINDADRVRSQTPNSGAGGNPEGSPYVRT